MSAQRSTKNEMSLIITATDERTCDKCAAQEGRHYCMFHGRQVKNMDAVRCDDWQEQQPGVADYTAITPENRPPFEA